MAYFQQLALAAAVSSAFVLTGCGGSSSGSPAETTTETTSISGTAEAPSGSVASLEPVSPLQFAINFMVSPVAAAITGLQPVGGATVELIRVDNAGVQQGDVLASSVTSITGDYNLEIPAGTSLAGDLVVRIQGSNTEMRAQAVDRDVDINPISEYVLQKFIAKGTELSSLTTSSVVELTGKAEEFDIAATSDLSTMIEALETEMGDFIDGQVTQITSDSADVTEIAGDWRNMGFGLGLGDHDNFSSGFLNPSSINSNFDFANAGSGMVDVTISGRSENYAILDGQDGGNAFLSYFTEITNGEAGSFTGRYIEGGIVTLEIPFEERLDGDSGLRFPPATIQFQKAAGNNVFFFVNSDPKVSYKTVDTNGDGEPDALDPGQKEGDEIVYSMNTIAKKPTNATATGLAGDFGRVYLGTYHENNVYEVENELNIITFNDNSTVDVGDEQFQSLSRTLGGTPQTNFTSDIGPAEAGLVFNLLTDGRIDSVGLDDAGEPEPVNLQVDDALNLIVGSGSEGADGDFASFSKTIMVRLPETAPNLSARKYRVNFLAMDIFGDVGVEIRRSRFDSTMSFVDNNSASIDLGVQAAGKFTEGLLDQIEVTTERFESDSVDVTVNADGSATIVIGSAATGGPTTAEGFFNQDGSIGVFRTTYDEDGDGATFEPSELGLMILAEMP